MHHQTIGRASALPTCHLYARVRPRRLLCFGTGHFPDPAQTFSYELAADLADRVDAEVRFAHFEKADPRLGGGAQLRWMPYGLLAPHMQHPVRADVEHFRRTRPERFASLVDGLTARLGVRPDELLQMPNLLAAISQARWAEAWAPDVVVTFHSHLGAVAGLVTAWLLDLPRVHFHYPYAGAAHPFAALHQDILRFADVVCVPGTEQRLALRREFDGELDHRTLSQSEHPNWQIALAARAQDAMRVRSPAAARADLGPVPAFANGVRLPPIDAEPAGPTPFVVVGAERTGSNLIVDMLATHPDIASAGELFNPRLIEEGRLDTQVPDGIDAAALMRLRREDPGACLDALVGAAARQGRRAVGCKLLYYHMLSDDRVVERLLSMPGLRVVHLVRRDRVARYVSHVRAERTDLWWSAPSDDEAQRRGRGDVEIDPRMLLWDMQFVEQLEERTRATFAGVRGVEIAYEDFAADLDGTAARVLELLGVPRAPLVPQSQKQGDSDVRKRIVNWEDLRAVFRGTRWGGLF